MCGKLCEMQAPYIFNAEERFHGPPRISPEQALDYEEGKAAVVVERVRPPSRAARHRPPSRESPFVVVQTPEPSFVADTIDPSPCPTHHA